MLVIKRRPYGRFKRYRPEYKNRRNLQKNLKRRRSLQLRGSNKQGMAIQDEEKLPRVGARNKMGLGGNRNRKDIRTVMRTNTLCGSLQSQGPAIQRNKERTGRRGEGDLTSMRIRGEPSLDQPGIRVCPKPESAPVVGRSNRSNRKYDNSDHLWVYMEPRGQMLWRKR